MRFLKAIQKALWKRVIYVTLENPATSAPRDWGPTVEALSLLKAEFATFDMCRLGASYRKNALHSRLRECLDRRRCCSGPRIILQGKVTVPQGDALRSAWLAELAGKYPPGLSPRSRAAPPWPPQGWRGLI